MDVPEPDGRLLPRLETTEVWVALDSASAPPKGAPAILESPDARRPLLVGIDVATDSWEGKRLQLYGGPQCQGTVDRLAVAVLVQFAEGAAPWEQTCADISRCSETVARQTWDISTHPLLVAHVTPDADCPGVQFAQVGGHAPPISVKSALDEHMANLAIARFRQLDGWRGVQERWIRAVNPLDSTEWDTFGGASPEVGYFAVPGEKPLLTVAAAAGDGCPGSFQADFSAVFELRPGPSLKHIQPRSLPPEAPFPGFAPTILNALSPGTFAAPGRRAGPRVSDLDVRPKKVGFCPSDRRE